MSYKKIRESYKNAKRAYECWSLANSLLDKLPETLNIEDPAAVFMLYLYYGDTKQTAKFFKDSGIKCDAECVSRHIRITEIEDKDLQYVVRSLLELNSRHS